MTLVYVEFMGLCILFMMRKYDKQSQLMKMLITEPEVTIPIRNAALIHLAQLNLVKKI